MTKVRVRMMITSAAVTIVGTERDIKKRGGARNDDINPIAAMMKTPQIVIAVVAEVAGRENIHDVGAGVGVAARVYHQKGEIHLANMGEMMKDEENIAKVAVTYLVTMTEVEHMIMEAMIVMALGEIEKEDTKTIMGLINIAKIVRLGITVKFMKIHMEGKENLNHMD